MNPNMYLVFITQIISVQKSKTKFLNKLGWKWDESQPFASDWRVNIQTHIFHCGSLMNHQGFANTSLSLHHMNSTCQSTQELRGNASPLQTAAELITNCKPTPTAREIVGIYARNRHFHSRAWWDFQGTAVCTTDQNSYPKTSQPPT